MRFLLYFILFLSVFPFVFCVRYMLVTRNRSRNFAKFGGVKWDLPRIELNEMCGDFVQTFDYWPDAVVDSQATLFKGIRMNENENSVDDLIQGSKKCVLMHGLCEILADMPSMDHLVDACSNMEASSATDIDQLKISVCKIDNPYMTKQEIQSLLGQLSIPKFIQFVNLKSQFPSCNELRIYVYKERILLGKLLAKGISSPKNNEYHDPLPILSSYRRNRNGILKDLAIHTMNFKGFDTPMEPEIGLLMTNLALTRNQVNVTVLDPFCGSCLILLAAATQCFNATLIGVDRALTPVSMADIHKNFRKHNIEPPSLYAISAETLLADEMAQHVDAIVTDIPYEMKVQFLSNGDEVAGESASCKQAKVDDSTRLLLSIAAKLLKSRGRLVFFYPVRLIRGSHSDSLQQMLQPLNQNLTLIHKIPQDMSATFRRYLVVVERA
jgi:tRNA G10  N-methylase Trm11